MTEAILHAYLTIDAEGAEAAAAAAPSAIAASSLRSSISLHMSRDSPESAINISPSPRIHNVTLPRSFTACSDRVRLSRNARRR